MDNTTFVATIADNTNEELRYYLQAITKEISERLISQDEYEKEERSRSRSPVRRESSRSRSPDDKYEKHVRKQVIKFIKAELTISRKNHVFIPLPEIEEIINRHQHKIDKTVAECIKKHPDFIHPLDILKIMEKHFNKMYKLC